MVSRVIDATLLQAAQLGDQDAFRRLVEPLGGQLYRVAFSVTGHAQDAEDARQNALIRAWQHLPDLREPHTFRGWLTRVVLNEAKTLVKKRASSPVAAEELPEVAVESLVNSADWLTLQSFLRLLPTEQREVIVMRFWLDLPLQQIADTVKVPLSTAKARLYRGMEALRDLLSAGMN